ncbi:MAG TPA: ribbon-helix-helix domain-containing protein [Woeseiaceae bacterium]|nr:ribbon-helix-helix domain-containing protein [Woeseiaceae bacterium]
MRTTITIDDHLAERIEELRRARGLSMKKVINLLLREGLEHQSKPPQPKRFRIRTHRLRLRPGFDPEKLNELSDELESEAFLEKQLRHRR